MGRKKLTEKKCPRCGIIKPRAEYYEYYSKQRGAMRIDSRCKACSVEACRPAIKRYYEKNKEMLLQKLADWQNNNRERLKKYQYEYNKKGIKQLSPSYLNCLFKKFTNLNPYEHPDLLAAYKNQLLIKRRLKNGEKQANRS